MKLIVKVFPEITIKSRPVRMRFVRQLAKNIRTVLRDLDPAVVVTGVWDNIELQTRVSDPKALKEMTERLSCMPGIAHFLQVDEYPLGDFDDIVEKCKLHFGEALAGKIFSVRCKRAGKHPFTSMEVEKYVGSKLRRECGAAGIELKKPEIEVRIEIRDQRLFVIHNQHDSIGGYPLGSLEQQWEDYVPALNYRFTAQDEAFINDLVVTVDVFVLAPHAQRHQKGQAIKTEQKQQHGEGGKLEHSFLLSYAHTVVTDATKGRNRQVQQPGNCPGRGLSDPNIDQPALPPVPGPQPQQEPPERDPQPWVTRPVSKCRER
ncbi:thiamine biosynthesis protein [Pseudomonas fragi]|uniref:Thiamine biosynthesis protein n=1 Tax=Pseudomonas fragi TaxID=296 RepID=A0A449IG05_PSEFR|nr:thiamine biosynthesis protein [Pseudomonas fragi]